MVGHSWAMAPKPKRPKNFDQLVPPGIVDGYAYHVTPSGVVKVRGVGDVWLPATAVTTTLAEAHISSKLPALLGKAAVRRGRDGSC